MHGRFRVLGLAACGACAAEAAGPRLDPTWRQEPVSSAVVQATDRPCETWRAVPRRGLQYDPALRYRGGLALDGDFELDVYDPVAGWRVAYEPQLRFSILVVGDALLVGGEEFVRRWSPEEGLVAELEDGTCCAELGRAGDAVFGISQYGLHQRDATGEWSQLTETGRTIDVAVGQGEVFVWQAGGAGALGRWNGAAFGPGQLPLDGTGHEPALTSLTDDHDGTAWVYGQTGDGGAVVYRRDGGAWLAEPPPTLVGADVRIAADGGRPVITRFDGNAAGASAVLGPDGWVALPDGGGVVTAFADGETIGVWSGQDDGAPPTRVLALDGDTWIDRPTAPAMTTIDLVALDAEHAFATTGIDLLVLEDDRWSRVAMPVEGLAPASVVAIDGGLLVAGLRDGAIEVVRWDGTAWSWAPVVADAGGIGSIAAGTLDQAYLAADCSIFAAGADGWTRIAGAACEGAPPYRRPTLVAADDRLVWRHQVGEELVIEEQAGAGWAEVARVSTDVGAVLGPVAGGGAVASYGRRPATLAVLDGDAWSRSEVSWEPWGAVTGLGPDDVWALEASIYRKRGATIEMGYVLERGGAVWTDGTTVLTGGQVDEREPVDVVQRCTPELEIQ